MCGITGYSFTNDDAQESIIAAMATTLTHRGPDATGYYVHQGTALGHLRLSILDLSQAANQPMHSHCGRYVMVYNGEIYNYKEILQEVQNIKPHFVPQTSSDTEVILEAFTIWETDFVEKLNGMFAIAIYDKSNGQLFLFRDRLGIKPIYYYHSQGKLAFASELKALKAHPEIQRHFSLNEVAINQFLHLGYIPAPNSIYKEIHKFPAGSFARFLQGELTITPYWQADHKLKSEQISDKHEALQTLRNLVESSVKYRLISDVPYGTFLSGGIDSSLVTAVAQSLHNNPINTFSIGFWDQEYNEASYARKIAEHLGTRHHELIISEKEALEWMPRLNHIFDEPFADSSAIPTLLVSQMARQHVTMTLSGDGGDELFFGYGAYIWARRLSAAWIPAVRMPAAMLLNMGTQRYKRAAGLFENPGKHFLRSHIFSQEQYLFSRKEIQHLLQKHLQHPFSLREKPLNTHLQLSPEEEQALFDLHYYLPDDLLVKVDRASMHFGLETRVPLLDYRIVEFALNLHPDLKIRHGQAKWLLKQLLFEYLPKEYFLRPKKGFAIPLKRWLKKDLKDYAMAYLNPAAIARTGILEPKAVERLLKAFYQNDQEILYNKIWLLVVLQKWLMETQ